MSDNFANVSACSVSGICFLVPLRPAAVPFGWTSCPQRAFAHLLPYYETVRLPHRLAASSPLQLVSGFSRAMRLSQVPTHAVRLPATDLDPGTARQTHLRVRHATGFQEMKPLALCDVDYFGAQYLHLRCGRHPPSLWLRVARCLPTRIVQFRPGG